MKTKNKKWKRKAKRKGGSGIASQSY